MGNKNYDSILQEKIEVVEKLLEIANKNKETFENKKELTKQEKKDYDLLIKYIDALNIIILHKQQMSNPSQDPLSDQTEEALKIIINSDYNR